MWLPAIQGIIDRRILVNYRVNAEIAARLLPRPFRPKLANGYAVAGICLIRLKDIRPKHLPPWIGISSENAAHRFAVEWKQDGKRREGVYIPRRDSNSRLNTLLGGRMFPGEHHHASFQVAETENHLQVGLRSDDGKTAVDMVGTVSHDLGKSALFSTLADASKFFEGGSLGYSATQSPHRFNGLELCCNRWSMQPLDVQAVKSSYFSDPALFARGSAVFDCALLMRGIEHEWHAHEDLCCE